jgi:hypothetical protein
MLETVSTISFVLLAVVGTADLVRFLFYRMLKSNNMGKLYLVLSIRGHEEGAEVMLTSAIERLKWMKGEDTKLICVDYDMDEETRKVCGIICAQNPGIEVCTPEELPDLLKQ